MKRYILLSLALFPVAIFNLSAQSGVKTKSVAVFKNGSGFFVKSGTVKPTTGRVTMDDTINAAFGTLWFSSGNNTITRVTSKMEIVEHVKPALAGNTVDLLKGNIGKRLKITAKDEEPVEGVIEKVDDDMLIVKAPPKWVQYKISSLNKIEFLEQPAYSTVSKDKTRITQVDLKEDKESTLDMMYLQKGISWLPTYLVELEPGNKAQITLTADLVNDAENLDNADVSLVVGVPNFKYAGLLSPLTSIQSVTEFLYGLSHSGRTEDNYRNVMSNSIMTQSRSSGDFGGGQDNGEKALATFELEGATQEDLYFYRLNSISLPKAGRGFYTVLKEEVPFRHIYESDLTANTQSDDYSNSSTGGLDNNEQNTNKVYHSIELENTTKLPWTTGSAMAVKPVGGVAGPLSEDMLAYTPVKAKVCVKITESPDIWVKDAEVETARAEKKKVIRRASYDLISVDAEITIKNYKSEDIDLTLRRVVNGDLKSCSAEWTSKKVVSLERNPNTVNNVKWDVHLKAGEEKKITYKYQVFVAR